MNRRNGTQAEPFLKWVGGKTRRVDDILALMPDRVDVYAEPFLGGGAVALEVLRRNPQCTAILSDLNPHLINCWRQVRDRAEELVTAVHALDDPYLLLRTAEEQRAYYLKVRKRWNDEYAGVDDDGRLDPLEQAALFLWLNRNCFQGLWRVNSRGEFNVPPRRHHTDKSRVNYRAVLDDSILLRRADIQQGGFRDCVLTAGVYVFVDPPYIRENSGRGFTAYNSEGFTDEDHLALAEKLRLSHAPYVLTIGGEEDLVREIYGRPDVTDTIPCTFAATNAGRRTRREFIITNIRKDERE